VNRTVFLVVLLVSLKLRIELKCVKLVWPPSGITCVPYFVKIEPSFQKF